MKYRKKPIVIEAQQLTRMMASVVVKWIGEENISDYNLGEFFEDTCYIEIQTLEGNMIAREFDYIICGIDGEFYPIREDIFNKTYERVNDNEMSS